MYFFSFNYFYLAIDRLGITLGHTNGNKSRNLISNSILQKTDRLFKTGTPEAIKVKKIYFIERN